MCCFTVFRVFSSTPFTKCFYLQSFNHRDVLKSVSISRVLSSRLFTKCFYFQIFFTDTFYEVFLFSEFFHRHLLRHDVGLGQERSVEQRHLPRPSHSLPTGETFQRISRLLKGRPHRVLAHGRNFILAG
jgi:hypothetical protein